MENMVARGEAGELSFQSMNLRVKTSRENPVHPNGSPEMHHKETRSRRQRGKIIMTGNTLRLRLPLSVARTWQMISRCVQVEQTAAGWKAHSKADLTG